MGWINTVSVLFGTGTGIFGLNGAASGLTELTR